MNQLGERLRRQRTGNEDAMEITHSITALRTTATTTTTLTTRTNTTMTAILVACCLIFAIPSASAAAATPGLRGLRNLTLSIDPDWVRRGHSAQLHCDYDLNGVPLYSVKWYRGNLEFYRYSPFENPSAKIFPYTGIKVDLSESNATQVTLRNVGFTLSGNFTCEVTADAPSFFTATGTNILTVVELPHSPPTLFTERDRYDVGDMLRANCSTPPSKPAATIQFYLNDLPVSTDETVLHEHDHLQWASRELSLRILPSHYHGVNLLLRCTAEVKKLYAASTDAPLWSSRKEPIPERVTSPSSASAMAKWWPPAIGIICVLILRTAPN